MNEILRPQPIGIYPMPVNYLVLPQVTDAEGAIAALLRGEATAPLPDGWRFFARAFAGDVAEAWQTLEHDTSDVAEYNRFVLRSDLQTYARLRLSLTGTLRVLLDVVAFTLGYIAEPPTAEGLDGELAALVLAAHASKQIEMDAAQPAIKTIERAIAQCKAVSPLFAAQLLGQLASLRRSTPGQVGALAIQHYQEAISLAGDTPYQPLLAELWLNSGMTYHELSNGQRGALLEATRCYQQAIRHGLSEHEHAEMYAMAHNNLALAYLSMPMTESSDQLRMAIAVQSLREALKVYSREAYPELWASAQINLANALQYLPSSHPQDNLVQAVEIYEEVLQVRNKAFDPVGYARLLSNQANALAHLGIFQPAIEKLNEAHKLFHWHNEPDMAATTLQLVQQINEQLDEAGRVMTK